MDFIDGFVAAVPTENKAQYIEHAKQAAEVFKDHGASRVIECWGEDVPDGVKTSFPMAVQCEANETVVFSWVYWPSKEARDQGWAKISEDERMNTDTMPFDASRIIFGGFQMVVDA